MKKNTFKKVAALSVACAMSAGLLAGCGGGSSASSAATPSAGDSSASSEAAAPTAATVEGGTVTIYQQSDYRGGLGLPRYAERFLAEQLPGDPDGL